MFRLYNIVGIKMEIILDKKNEQKNSDSCIGMHPDPRLCKHQIDDSSFVGHYYVIL